MTWSVKIICDSVNPAGVRLTTFELEYPLIIHAEFMTHRVFSRNAASNRAIPAAKLIEQVERDPFIPEAWQSNQKGMVGGADLPQRVAAACFAEWVRAKNTAVEHAKRLTELGLHKQIVNRLLMPFQWIRVICTSTTYENFFKLRTAPDAEPHMQKLAKLMQAEYEHNAPEELSWGDWHLPYIQSNESHYCLEQHRRSSVARCARVSYLNHDKILDLEKDSEMHDTLAKSGHWSPFEHVAQAVNTVTPEWDLSNFHPSWYQYRKGFVGEDGSRPL